MEILIWNMFLEVAVATLAVFGFYCAVKAFAAWLFRSKQIQTAVVVQTREDADTLDLLLYEASRSFLQTGMGAPVVLISSALMDGTVGVDETLLDAYADLIDEYGAACYLVEM